MKTKPHIQKIIIGYVHIRIATEEDIPQIINLNLKEYSLKENEAYDHFELVQWWGTQDLLTWHMKLIKANQGEILVAVENGTVVGELDFVISPHQNRGHVIWLLVDRDFRKKGIAEALIEAMRKHVENTGIVHIWTEAEDERTEQLYAKNGTIADVLQNYWLDLNVDVEGPLEQYDFKFEDGELSALFKRENPYKVRAKAIHSNLPKEKYIEILSELKRVVGDYLTPEFDLHQLVDSIENPSSQFIWGETTPMEIAEYEFDEGIVVAIVTQYTRIYVDGEVGIEQLKTVIVDLIYLLFQRGFVSLDIQVLKSRQYEKMLADLGFMLLEEDPIYNIGLKKGGGFGEFP